MNRKSKTFLLLAVLLILFTPTPVTAFNLSEHGESASVISIEYANYLDLDGDAIEDDVLTIFTIESLYDMTIYATFMSVYVRLPSGRTFTVFPVSYEDYAVMTVTISWYGIAVESGWYEFGVYMVRLSSYIVEFDTNSVEFDPPTEGEPGPPLAGQDNVTITIETEG